MTTTTDPVAENDVKKCLTVIVALLSGIEVTSQVIPTEMGDVVAPMLGLGDNTRTFQILLADGEPKLYRKITLTQYPAREEVTGYMPADLGLIEVLGMAKAMNDTQLANLEDKLKKLKEGEGGEGT